MHIGNAVDLVMKVRKQVIAQLEQERADTRREGVPTVLSEHAIAQYTQAAIAVYVNEE